MGIIEFFKYVESSDSKEFDILTKLDELTKGHTQNLLSLVDKELLKYVRGTDKYDNVGVWVNSKLYWLHCKIYNLNRENNFHLNSETPIKNTLIALSKAIEAISAFNEDVKNGVSIPQRRLTKIVVSSDLNRRCELGWEELKTVSYISNKENYNNLLKEKIDEFKELYAVHSKDNDLFVFNTVRGRLNPVRALISLFYKINSINNKIEDENLDESNNIEYESFFPFQSKDRKELFDYLVRKWNSKSNISFCYIYNHMNLEKEIISPRDWEDYVCKNYVKINNWNYQGANSHKNYKKLEQLEKEYNDSKKN